MPSNRASLALWVSSSRAAISSSIWTLSSSRDLRLARCSSGSTSSASRFKNPLLLFFNFFAAILSANLLSNRPFRSPLPLMGAGAAAATYDTGTAWGTRRGTCLQTRLGCRLQTLSNSEWQAFSTCSVHSYTPKTNDQERHAKVAGRGGEAIITFS